MPKSLSLRWLEVFQLVAKSGSIQQVASETGLSISTVSNHLRSLETALGIDLVDHGRRPMGLTPAGEVYARHVRDGLIVLKKAEAEIRSGNWRHATDLRLALIDDFDNQISPDLFRFLAHALPRCSFRHFTRPSHEIIAKLQEHKLDAGVATRPFERTEGLIEYPLMRDPFIVVLPGGFSGMPEEMFSSNAELPLLRYSRDYVIGKQIEIQLRRGKFDLPNRFELECNQSIIGLVAEGTGWTITTAASFHRAHRFHDQVRVVPFPGRNFVRTVSLFTTDVYPETTSKLIQRAMGKLIRQHFTDPMCASHAWLKGEFRTMENEAA
ncbi:LysR family transcriptional regulator [Ruegeria faecimaris]|uniref:DNA-binding transcriptional regulator, LysR family n=1 Tax=Ruegeria faecimaris TaxID=686389 RepID=A0A521DRR3_9RHOB|nr:LysR family transcriptional regulator [Ruegeria faecimaris]SMO74275.1 DNA-binding transcriptional regulator, LysR family [Ruegeria faecimaris]